MSRFDANGNYIEPKLGLHDGKIAFDANYGREGLIQVTDTVCQGCNKAAMCLYVDQSENEYYPATVCRNCIAKLFETPSEVNGQ